MPDEILLPLVAGWLKAQGLTLFPKEQHKLVADIDRKLTTSSVRPAVF
jgi:hypothetical protein